jgi:Protein of unknown function (DUF3429)
MPFPALLFSLIGLAPFIGCGLAALGPHAGATEPWLQAFIGYAAVILSFVGGVYWGFILREPGAPPNNARIGLAIVPLLFGWAALVASVVVAYWLALLVLIAGYILAIAIGHQGSQRGLIPGRYLWLHWTFTIVAVAMLTTVVTLRLLGQTIAF